MENNKRKAVTLKYPEGAYAPFITAKGSGLLADKIIKEAEKNNVHIEENQEIIDFLTAYDVGSCVPEETWQILAEIFSFILKS